MPVHGCLLANETARVAGSYPDLPSWEEGNSVRLGIRPDWQLYIVVGASWAKVFENIWPKY